MHIHISRDKLIKRYIFLCTRNNNDDNINVRRSTPAAIYDAKHIVCTTTQYNKMSVEINDGTKII